LNVDDGSYKGLKRLIISTYRVTPLILHDAIFISVT